MAKLDGLVLGLNRSLKAIGAEAAGIRKIAAAGDATGMAMERASRHTAELERRLAALKIAGNVPTVPTMLPGAGGGGRGGGGAGGGGRGWGGHGRGGAHGGNIHMGPGGVGIGTVGMAAGDAFVPLAITGAMLWGGHALYESAKDLNTEMQRFKLFGLSDKINNEAFQFVAGMKVYGTSQSENMKHFREAQGVFRESGLDDSEALAGAKLAAPMLGKIAFATEALDDESKARLRTSSMAMLRFVEMSGGLKDAGTFNRLANFGWKMVQTSGGTVDWEQLRQFKATSGVSGRLLTDDAIAGLEPVISELKGGRTGTSLRTAINRRKGIVRLPNQAAHDLLDAGIWDKSKVEMNANGGIKRFNGNPFTSSAEFQQNPAEWYRKNMLPMYDRKKLSEEQRGREDAMLFGSTGGAMFSLIRTMFPTIDKSVAANHKALGIDDSGAIAKKALGGQEVEFTAAWKDFKTQFGTAMLPTFTAILKDGAAVMRFIGDWVRENGEKMAFLKKTFGEFNPVQRLIGAASDLWSEHTKPEGSWAPSRINPVHGRSGQPAQAINNTIVMPNGQVLAKVVTEVQTKQANRPATGGARFDSSMSPSPVGATGSW